MAAVWCSNDLERRVLRALEVASQAVARFGVDGHADAEQPLQGFGPEKPVAEAAMLLYAAHASRGRPAIGARVQALAEQLAPLARSQRVMFEMALNPSLVFKLAVPHILLSAVGHRDAGFDAWLAQAAATRLRDGHERAPAALLERRWITGLWAALPHATAGTATAAAACATAACRGPAPRSLLHQPLDVLGGLRDDAYVFTHLLFYATDFGRRPQGLPAPRRHVLGQASALLARYLDAEDYDLSAELLLAWPFSGARWSPTASFAFQVLASVEDRCGLLPCGNVDLQRLSRLQGEARQGYALGTAYHTALVMGLLCAAALRPGAAPPRLPAAPAPGPQRSTAAAPSGLTALMPFIDHTRGHWQPLFEGLAPAVQRRLLPFLLDMAIVQTTRRRDPAALASLLQWARQHGPAGGELWHQGAERLQRLAQLSLALHAGAGAGSSADADKAPAPAVAAARARPAAAPT